MSLAINKFSEGDKIRTYKRGYDEVDLNAFIRQSEAGFNDWLANANIKNKYKEEVRNAYRDMLTRINNDPDSFTAKIGGGFTNNANITNKTKGFDAYGIAAGYLGDTLRGMQAYIKPETKSTASTKTKYSRDSKFIDKTIQSQILGDNPDSFIMLDNDSYNENTGSRGNQHRIAQTISGLNTLKSRLRDYRDFENDDDYNHAVGRIDDLIKILQDENSNNDWFALGQLGFTDVDKYFITGNERRTAPLNEEETKNLESRNRIKDFENYMSTNYPFYTGNLASIQIDPRNGTGNNDYISKLQSGLSALDNDILDEWVRSYIYNPNSDFTHYPQMISIFGGVTPQGTFTTGQIMRSVLSRLIANNSDKLKKISDTAYYIPSMYVKNSDNSSTVYVYDSSTQTIKQVDTQDIEDYRNQYLQSYLQANPQVASSDSRYRIRYPQVYGSYKEGGILKAQQGRKFNTINEAITYLAEDLSKDKRLRSVFKNGSFEYVNRNDAVATDEINSENNQYDPDEGGAELEKQEFYQNWLKILENNATVAEAFAQRYKDLQPTTDVHYSQWYDSDGKFNHKKFLESRVNNKRVFDDAINGIGHDFYRGRVYQIIDENGNPLEGYYNTKLDGYDIVGSPELDEKGNLAWIYKMQKKKTESDALTYDENYSDEPSDGSDFNEVTGGKEPYQDPYSLDEKRVRSKSQDSDKPKDNSVWSELGVGLLGAGRLAGSIMSNNRIAETVRKSLSPNLHTTYELYSPVTGAFSEMQLRNRQGANVMSRVSQPFTSDASLTSARMLEGQSYANDLQYRGFLADDKEIKRTQAEALRRQEDNTARRTATANENRDAINKYNQALGQLEASRLKQNWNSIDNYLKGIESRYIEDVDYAKAQKRNREAQVEEIRRQYTQLQDQNTNSAVYQPELDRIDKLVSAWEAANTGKSVESQTWYKTVQDRRAELADRLKEDNLYSNAVRNGLSYTNKYKQPGKYYDPQAYDWSKIILRKGGKFKNIK